MTETTACDLLVIFGITGVDGRRLSDSRKA